LNHSLVGNHPSIDKIRKLIDMVADTGFNVLITGETGTGKEVVARMLHARSARRSRRFVKVNCGALPGTLLESELFGYEKGAFTGAVRLKPGKFELASKGVILLDEIGDMPMALQAKILEVLQSSSVLRLGGTREVTVDTWVIASTNCELEHNIKLGLFREDLYYRLNVIKIEIPPLRERKDDITEIVKYLAERNRKQLGLDGNFRIPPQLEEVFLSYHWPGNVRELSNFVLRLMAGETHKDIKAEITRTLDAEGRGIDQKGNSNGSVTGPVNDPEDGQPPKPIPLKTLKAEAEKVIEAQAIQYAIQASRGNKRQAARLLKISYKTLYNKLESLGIDIREN